MKSHITDRSFFEEWLREKKQLAESTIYMYTRSLERFLAGNPDIDNLNEYNNFLVKVAVKKRCPHYYSVLKAFIEFKIPDANTKNRLLTGMIIPKQKDDIVRERKYLSEDKIFDIINFLDKPKHKVVALIQTLTGVRAGDILRLKYGGIEPEEYEGRSVLKLNLIGKGKRRNVIFIHDEVAQQVIMDYITTNSGVQDYYFLEYSTFRKTIRQEQSEDYLLKMNYWWFWADLKQALQTAGVSKNDFATHDFRRCFARRVWEKWKDIHVLQSMLNHQDPKVTLRYLEQSGLKNVDYHAEMQR